MKPGLGRIALLVTLILCILWLVSMPASIFWRVTAQGPTVGVGAGAVSLLMGPPKASGIPAGSGLFVINRLKAFPDSWWWRLFWLPETTGTGVTPPQYRLPLWILVAAFGAPGVFLTRRASRAARRARLGQCASCGYELGALPRCPECGATRPSSPDHSA